MNQDPRYQAPKVKVAVKAQVSPAPIAVLIGLLSLVVLLLGGAISGT
ncbi:MAG: hypothetical protein ACSHXY_12240 [Alphaproteobacteria bacterium]